MLSMSSRSSVDRAPSVREVMGSYIVNIPVRDSYARDMFIIVSFTLTFIQFAFFNLCADYQFEAEHRYLLLLIGDMYVRTNAN